MAFKIGQMITKETYTQAAVWCNQNAAHIEDQEKVLALEVQTGLTRTLRELVLAENSGASDYAKQQAQEIETLAAPLRGALP